MEGIAIFGFILFLFFFGTFSLIMDHICTPKEIEIYKPNASKNSPEVYEEVYEDFSADLSDEPTDVNYDDSLFN